MKHYAFSVAVLLCGCQSVWGSLSIPNPENCVSSPSLCLADEVCDPHDQICHPALTIYAVSPSMAPTKGGGTVRILGERFLPDVQVSWQGQPIPDVQYVSPIELLIPLPATQAQTWLTPITVRNPTGQTVTRSDLFSYYSDSIQFAASRYSEPRSAINMAIGDFNRDGKKDVAFVSNSNSAVAICLGKGDGTIVAASYIASGSASRSTQDVQTLDVDGDGNLDLVVSAADSVQTYRGDGKGGFSAGPSIATGSTPSRLSWTKLSPSPQRTLMVSDSTDMTLTLLTLRSDGTYTRNNTIPTGSMIAESTACDTSGDGIDELYWIDPSGSLHVAQPKGVSDFLLGTVPIAGCVAQGMTCRDLNQDGRTDLLLTCQNGLLPIYGQAGGMAPGSLLALGRSPSAHVLAEDVSGDGWPDIVFGDQGQKATMTMLSDRKGGYQNPALILSEPVGLGVNSALFRVADMDGDHRPDVLIGFPFTLPLTTIAVMLNRSQ